MDPTLSIRGVSIEGAEEALYPLCLSANLHYINSTSQRCSYDKSRGKCSLLANCGCPHHQQFPIASLLLSIDSPANIMRIMSITYNKNVYYVGFLIT